LAHSPARAQFSHSGCWFAQRGFVAAVSATKARAGIRRGIASIFAATFARRLDFAESLVAAKLC